jgi:hypothetical protein
MIFSDHFETAPFCRCARQHTFQRGERNQGTCTEPCRGFFCLWRYAIIIHDGHILTGIHAGEEERYYNGA